MCRSQQRFLKRMVPTSYQQFMHPQMTSSMKQAVMKQLDETISIYDHSGIYKEFEERFASVMRLQPPFDRYCLSTSSGTAALYSLYFGAFQQFANQEQEVEVIVPSYTFFATVTPLLQLNALCKIKIKFADCSASNGNVDPQSIEQQISEKTRAIIITHMWGIPCDLDAIVKICHHYGVRLLQDCSHAHGATYNGLNVGNFGDGSAWSLQGKKLITAGEGGILSTKHQAVFEQALLIGHFNKRATQQIQTEENLKYAPTGCGLKLRMNVLGTALANEQLKNNHFCNLLKEKQEIAAYIAGNINNNRRFQGLATAKIPANATASYYALPILWNKDCFKCDLQQFVSTLHEYGVLYADIPGSTCPLDKFEVFQRFIDRDQEQFKNANQFHQSMFKIDVWYGERRKQYADYFLEALEDVCALYRL